ncbi:MAG: dihydropteroate synthase, partial [Proteobacteria bacterium]|nr:dihydropteroate synthase [Pseudomonadota bacterium]
AIVDAFDEELKAFAAGHRPDLRELVFQTMDGEDTDLTSLTKEQANYIKTTRVLTGKTLYSDSWLEF